MRMRLNCYMEERKFLVAHSPRHLHHMCNRKLTRCDTKARKQHVRVFTSRLSHSLVDVTHMAHVHGLNVVEQGQILGRVQVWNGRRFTHSLILLKKFYLNPGTHYPEVAIEYSTIAGPLPEGKVSLARPLVKFRDRRITPVSYGVEYTYMSGMSNSLTRWD